ncbi:MAG: type III pantothenate kinase [Pseudomonadales bacterium]
MSYRDPFAPQLLIDVGNTRSKWRVQNGNGSVIAAGSSSGTLETLPENIAATISPAFAVFLASGSPSTPSSTLPSTVAAGESKQAAQLARCKVALVRDDTQKALLEQALRQVFGCEVAFAKTQSHSHGIVNSYADPSSMGVDRWCAILAAAHASHIPGGNNDICIVDAGSAVTIDWVDRNGKHLGGYITPGYAMQVRELLSGTGRVFATESAPEHEIAPGDTTQLAVHNGILASIVAHIEMSIERHRRAGGAAPQLYLSGGDAGTIAKHLDTPCEIREELVLDGLALLLP